MKTEKPFLSKSAESFTFCETYCLRQYQIGLIQELNNNLYEAKQKRFFMAEIQRIEKFVKTINKYAGI
jgi:hypothetical protein